MANARSGRLHSKGGERRRPARTALVLAGGGARAAYEAGVIHYLFEELASKRGVPVRFDVLAGTSAGALNATFLAATADRPIRAAHELATYWRSLSMDRVLRFGPRELAHSLSLFLGAPWATGLFRPESRRPPSAFHRPFAGLFDVSHFRSEMRSLIPLDGIERNLASGLVHGVALCATEVCTGRPVVFYQSGRASFRPSTDPARHSLPVSIGLDHAMGSAAIPFLFPSVQIDGICYVDGALRQNTPLKPALAFGAEKVLVVSLVEDPGHRELVARLTCRRNPYPGVLFLLGRVLQTLAAGTLDYDLQRIDLFNHILTRGARTYGPSFARELNRMVRARRGVEYRVVRTCHIRPSRNLNDLALEAHREAPDELRLRGPLGPVLARAFSSAAALESELTSYLMFAPTYLRRLVDLGWSDAHNSRHRLTEFFAD